MQVGSHLDTYGMAVRVHGNKGKSPKNALTVSEINTVVMFLQLYANKMDCHCLEDSLITDIQRLCFYFLIKQNQMSRGMTFPTMWYVRPAKPQISLRIRAV